MNLFESNFMRKARYMTEEKRALLLDTMEQTRQERDRLTSIYQKSGYEGRKAIQNEWDMLFKTALVTAWMLVDHPKDRTAQQVQMRIKEMKKLITTEHKAADMFAAVCFRIIKEDWEERIDFSDEHLSDAKKVEYKECFQHYFDLSDADRDRFIREVTHPYSTYKPHRLVKMGRGIAD